MLRMPASATTSASPNFAQVMPTAPAFICNLAMAVHLWLLKWGRSRQGRRAKKAAIRSRLAFKAPASKSKAGVSTEANGVKIEDCSVMASEGISGGRPKEEGRTEVPG